MYIASDVLLDIVMRIQDLTDSKTLQFVCTYE